ncbi:methyltransferase [Epilithonimonas sp.]|uniref:methyltransferase family protein n=1 Tax=Epilithonimonas sp. TaxID=2894511 RepID=UPI0028A8381C|nr:methyltransferase [Epilithonimonas sp.]
MALKEELEKQGNWLFRYRSFLPLIVLVVGLAVLVQTSLKKESFDCSIYYELFCLFVSIIGLGIRIYTVGFTPKNTSGRNTKEGQVADKLNTTGIYSIVRNPLYLGNFFMWLGLAMFTENVWFIICFILFYWIYYERIIFAECNFWKENLEIITVLGQKKFLYLFLIYHCLKITS